MVTTLYGEFIQYNSIRFDLIQIPAGTMVVVAPLIIYSLSYSFSYVAASDVATSRSTSHLFLMKRGAVVVCLLLLLLFSLSRFIIVLSIFVSGSVPLNCCYLLYILFVAACCCFY